MLKIGGYINVLIAIAHILGLIRAEQMFEVTGIAKEMNLDLRLTQTIPNLMFNNLKLELIPSNFG